MIDRHTNKTNSTGHCLGSPLLPETPKQTKQELQLRIARRVKATLDLPAETKLEYKSNSGLAGAGGRMSAQEGYTYSA